jgi:hypothetical protein
MSIILYNVHIHQGRESVGGAECAKDCGVVGKARPRSKRLTDNANKRSERGEDDDEDVEKEEREERKERKSGKVNEVLAWR